MTYLLQIYTSTRAADYEALSADEQKAITDEYMANRTDARNAGRTPAQGPETATTVRVQDGSTLTTDGRSPRPRRWSAATTCSRRTTSTRRFELAARIPAARMGGAIEVRPVVER